MAPAAQTRWHVKPVDWSIFIEREDLELYRAALHALSATGAPFAIGGGLSFSAYTRRWRFTKDLDLYIRPKDSEQMVAALKSAGFPDLFEKKKYDQGWSFRGHQGEVIVDLLWGMANYKTWVDDVWVTAGPELEFAGHRVRLLPGEEQLWAKLYVLQRTRCDWPDLLNLLHAIGARMDWTHMLDRVGEDVGVLGGLLSVFRWLCPQRSSELPGWVWERVGLAKQPPGAGTEADGHRAALIGHSNWFGATQEVVHV
jgi:hypothetical protein